MNIQNLSTIQHLQTVSETEFFNLIKDTKLNISSFPSINLYSSYTLEQVKAKVQSKKWYNVSSYDDTSVGCTVTPCLTDKILSYIDYTSSMIENYILVISVEYSTTCNTNPVSNINCVGTIRVDTTNLLIDFIIPSNIVQESVSKIPTSTDYPLTILVIIGASVGLYLIGKSLK